MHPDVARGGIPSPMNFLGKTRDGTAKIEEMRAKDQRLIKETLGRRQEAREQRFERLIKGVTGDDVYLRSDVTELLRLHSIEKARRKAQRFQDWNTNVYESIQRQMERILNPVDRQLLQSFSGVKNVDFTLPHVEPIARSDNFRDNPAYAERNRHYQECLTRRKMDILVEPEDTAETERILAGEIPIRDPRHGRSKPVLEPELWDQLKLQATPYGHFAQACAEGPGFRTIVKMGNHCPSEEDGVEAAGKRKTRWTKNDVGLLQGETAKRGQSIEHRTDLGSSSGAPSQDHYTFPQTRKATDNEFPLGKRIFSWKH